MPSEETTVDASQTCEGTCSYYEVARKLVLSDSERLYLEMMEGPGAYALEVDAEVLSITSGYAVQVRMQQTNDGDNWSAPGATTPALTFNDVGAKAGFLGSFGGRFARPVIQGNGSGSATLCVGVRFRVEPPKVARGLEFLLPGLDPRLPGVDDDYLLLADRLSVAQGAVAVLPPVAMRDFNVVQLDITVFATTMGLTIGARVEGSSDAQTWEELATYSGIGVGATMPSAATSISHRFVRVSVLGPQSFGPAELALGMKLSKE